MEIKYISGSYRFKGESLFIIDNLDIYMYNASQLRSLTFIPVNIPQICFLDFEKNKKVQFFKAVFHVLTLKNFF